MKEDMMKKLLGIVCLAGMTLLNIAAVAQQTREQAVAAMRKVEAKEMDATYTKPAPVAQKLVDEALAKHPEILLIAIHAAPPGHKNLIVASNFGRIGKIGDEDDMRCIHTGKSNLEMSEKGDHFEDELILLDKSGKTIGALGVVFNYKAGDDKLALQKIAEATRDEMKGKLSSHAALFAGAK
jgi:iron complex outermembrane receptor protein